MKKVKAKNWQKNTQENENQCKTIIYLLDFV